MVEGDFFIYLEDHAQRISAGTERLIELAKHKIRLTPWVSALASPSFLE